jgi:hypothetical protein
MMQLRTISLESLAHIRETEIEEILAGIQGKPGRTLWTSEFRASTRGGGKYVGVRIIDPTLEQPEVAK